MKKDVLLYISKSEYIEFNINDYVIFTGSNLRAQQLIYQTFKKISKGKLTLQDENIYGEEGLKFLHDKRKITQRNSTVLTIDSIDSLVRLFSLSKDGLFNNIILSYKSDYQIQYVIDQINDGFLLLETMFNEKIQNISQQLDFGLKSLTFDAIVKSFAEINANAKQIHVPFEYLSTDNLIVIFFSLIEQIILIEGKPVWIVIYHPETFMEIETINYMFKLCQEISNKTKLLYSVFIYNEVHNLNRFPDFENIILLFDRYEQLPSFEIVRQSIERNYPSDLNCDDYELSKRLLRIFKYTGSKNISNYSISPKDMVLLKVVKLILDDYPINVTTFEDLTPFEIDYLLKE